MRFPLDIWLIVFAYSDVSDYDTLWSSLRNVSQHLRECVDEYFRHAVLRKTIIMPFYSTIHITTEDKFDFLYVPMRFSRLSDDRTRAVFRQAHLEEHASSTTTAMNGSLHGWTPFIERYFKDMRKPTPPITGRTKGVIGPTAWETRYNFRVQEYGNPQPGYYMRPLRDHTSIGRGDFPPYFIHIADLTHNTNESGMTVLTHNTPLFDLAIDLPAREISLDWRRTFHPFFMERHFMVCAARSSNPRHVHDEDLVSAERAVFLLTKDIKPSWTRDFDDWRRARRKRMVLWTEQNKKRMSKEHRLMTEDAVMRMGREQQLLLERIVDLPDDEYVSIEDEIVPEKCAKDYYYPSLMMWPRNKEERDLAEEDVALGPRPFRKSTCVVM
jgi:hypothetical protein